MTVFGGSQVRPNIHIDDLVQVYLFALDRRLAGVYNAGFENLSVMEIAQRIAARIPAAIQILPSNDPRSYRQCSDRLLAAGFSPARGVDTAIDELAAQFAAGRLRDDPSFHNVSWMKQHSLS
jgi:nucleoside-diphosphate-sugar epimerase